MDRQKLQELRNTVATLLEQLEQMPEERFPDYKSYVSLKYRLKKLKCDGEWLAGEGDQLDEDPELTEEWRRLLEKMSRQVQDAETETKEMLASVKPLTTDQPQKAAEAFKEFDDFGSLYGLSRENYDSEEEYRVAVEYAEEVYIEARKRKWIRLSLLGVAAAAIVLWIVCTKWLPAKQVQDAKEHVVTVREAAKDTFIEHFPEMYPVIDESIGQTVTVVPEITLDPREEIYTCYGNEKLTVTLRVTDNLDTWAELDIYAYLEKAFAAAEETRNQVAATYLEEYETMYTEELEELIRCGFIIRKDIALIVKTSVNTYEYNGWEDGYIFNGFGHKIMEEGSVWVIRERNMKEATYNATVLPYVGMMGGSIDKTILGASDAHQSGTIDGEPCTIYQWIGQESGTVFFEACVSDDKVVAVFNYDSERTEARVKQVEWINKHRNNGSSSGTSSFGDSYSDPEEAYYWNTDDYFDYEDVEADFYD